ncbi:GGDEF domain-containing protein [Oryzomicrobium sp.]|uniref:GGDEF domain-containing protein n=1 Tax=Oryzomicrobium sp. TaxID=1911578 RepID=UPI002FDFC36F
MQQTEQTLLEQMHISELDIEYRKQLLNFTPEHASALAACLPVIAERIDDLVDAFYRAQTSVDEIALLIGDADTLGRLRTAQRRYILDLFSGFYDVEYVNNRLRIGMVHKRIGVEPRLYLSGIHELKGLLIRTLVDALGAGAGSRGVLEALDKLVIFDVTLVFETYIRSLVAEIETAKNKSDRYARSLEEKVSQRTQELEALTRTDSLTGIYNRRYLSETLPGVLRAAQRRNEAVTLVYLDVNDFKMINDHFGHLRGDEVLRNVGEVLRSVGRGEDMYFRYGGDEFCAILPNCTEAEAEAGFCRRLANAIADQLPGITLSVGSVQTGPGEYDLADALISQADARMYEAKQSAKRAAASAAEGNGAA